MAGKLSFRFEQLPVSGAPDPKYLNVDNPHRDAKDEEGGFDTTEELARAENYEPTLPVHCLVCLNLSMRGNACIYALDDVTRVLYVIALIVACGFAVLFFIRRNLLDLRWLDFYGYITWGVFVACELFLLLSRSFGRWSKMYKKKNQRHDEDSCTRLMRKIFQRDGYDNPVEFAILFACQVLASGLSTLGILVLIANIQRDSDEEQFGVDNLRIMWSVMFGFISLAYSLTALCDAVRVREIDSLRGWWYALEFTSWRVVLMVTAVPILSFFLILEAHVCCPGPWIFNRFS